MFCVINLYPFLRSRSFGAPALPSVFMLTVRVFQLRPDLEQTPSSVEETMVVLNVCHVRFYYTLLKL